MSDVWLWFPGLNVISSGFGKNKHAGSVMNDSNSMILLFRVVHTTLSSICAVLNILLIYVAIFKSPPMMRVYAVLVVNLAITDFSVSVLNFFLQQRIIPAGISLAFISTGPCSVFGEDVCYNAYSALLHLYTHSLWLLLISFSYRYWILFHQEPKRIFVQIVIILFYIPSFFQLIVFVKTKSNTVEVHKMLHSHFPGYNTTGLTVTGIMNVTHFGVMYTIIHIVVASTPIFITILVLRNKIIKKLTYKGVDVVGNTKNLHAQLLKVLTFQAIIPVFYLLGCCAYVIGQLGIFTHPALEYFVLTSFIFVPILSPVSSLYFVSPYRRFVKRLLLKTTRITAEPSVSTVGSYNNNSVGFDR